MQLVDPVTVTGHDSTKIDLGAFVFTNGRFRWVSPFGRVYWTRGEPVRSDLPDPDPADHPDDEADTQLDQRLRRYDPRILDRPATGPPWPPPPRPEPPPDDRPPPF